MDHMVHLCMGIQKKSPPPMPAPKQNKALLRGYQTIIELSLNNTLIRSNKVSVRGRVGIEWGYPQISNESMGMAFFEAHVFQLLLPKNLRQSSISEMAGSTYDQGEHLVGEPRCGASWSTRCVAKVFGFKALMFYFFLPTKNHSGKKNIRQGGRFCRRFLRQGAPFFEELQGDTDTTRPLLHASAGGSGSLGSFRDFSWTKTIG